MSWSNQDAAPGPYEFDQDWYDPMKHDANFVVLMNPAGPLDPIADWEVYATFGRPTKVYDFGPYVIMTYDTNLLTDLSPSLPPPSSPPPPRRPAREHPLSQPEQFGRGLGAGPGRAVGGQVGGAFLGQPQRQAHLDQDQVRSRREQDVHQGPGAAIPVRVADHRHQ